MYIRHWCIDLDCRVELSYICVDWDDKETFQRTRLGPTLPPRSQEDRNAPITAHHCDTKGTSRCLKRNTVTKRNVETSYKKTINPLFIRSKFHDFFNPSNLQDPPTVLNVIVHKKALMGFTAQKISMLLSKHNSVTIAVQLCWAIAIQLFLFNN